MGFFGFVNAAIVIMQLKLSGIMATSINIISVNKSVYRKDINADLPFAVNSIIVGCGTYYYHRSHFISFNFSQSRDFHNRD